MSHIMVIHSNVLTWECLSHHHQGKITKVDLRPFMRPEEVFDLYEARAEHLCARRK